MAKQFIRLKGTNNTPLAVCWWNSPEFLLLHFTFINILHYSMRQFLLIHETWLYLNCA